MFKNNFKYTHVVFKAHQLQTSLSDNEIGVIISHSSSLYAFSGELSLREAQLCQQHSDKWTFFPLQG